MTAHITYTALDSARCATVSPTVVQFMRREIGFDGLLMTDDLSMRALKGSFAEKTEASLAAGCDLVLHGNGALIGEPVRNLMAELREVAAASIPLQGDALRRAEAAQRWLPATPAHMAGLVTEWESLIA